MRVYEILPGRLYTRGTLRKMSPEAKRDGLWELGINVVVNLTRRIDVTLRDTLSLMYIHYPMPDGRLDEAQWIYIGQLASFLAERIKQNARVLIHCNAGRNRTGLLAALVVARVKSISTEEALAYVRHRRPLAVDNPHFERYLEEGACS